MTTTLAMLALAVALAPAIAPAHSCDHSAASGHSSHSSHADHASHAGHAAATGHSGHSGHAADEGPAATPLVKDDHSRWAPDAPLVEGMAHVRDAVATLAHHELGHMGEAHVGALAGDIDTAIASMFANCKLQPEPDVALHGLLARLMAGTQALHANPADAAPVADMRAAVQDYGRLFDDPGVDAELVKDDGDL